jgi:D-aspartate ligase
MPRTVIVASAGRQGLAVTRGLGERGVPVVVAHWDDDDLSAASRYATEVIRVPPPELEGGGFVERLLGLATRFEGAVVVPANDGAVKDIARRKEELERHFIVDCPKWEVAEKFIDKRHTYELADELGLAIPRTLVPESVRDLERFASAVEFPCLVKPRQSHLWAARLGGKFALVHSLAEMRESFAVARDAGLDVLIQELIPGPDRHGVNYNAYRCGTGVIAECTARKIRQGPPRSGLPRVVLSAEVPEVVEPGRRLLEGLGFEGFACTEFKLDARDGRYKLLEVNGRHNLSALLSIRSGVNFPWISYRYLVGDEVPAPVAARAGLYWIDEWLELAYSRTRAGRDTETWGQIIRPWVARHVFATFDIRDPAPFRIMARWIIRDAGKLIQRNLARSANVLLTRR